MKTVGSYEAKTHLTRLLDEVARGETVTITKHGLPVAELRPVGGTVRRRPSDVISALQRARKGVTLGEVRLRALIDEGRA
jgi:prevent-host-death family protein